MEDFVCNYFSIISVISEIDPNSVTWNVCNKSIQGKVEGAFSRAILSNFSNKMDMTITRLTGGNNVVFTGLDHGATYVVSLEYELQDSSPLTQYKTSLTIGKFKTH